MLVIHDDRTANMEIARLLCTRFEAAEARFETLGEASARDQRAVIVCADPEPDVEYGYPRGLFWLRWLLLFLARRDLTVLVTSASMSRLKRWGPEADWVRDRIVRHLLPADAIAGVGELVSASPAPVCLPPEIDKRRWRRWTPLDVAALAAAPAHRAANGALYAARIADEPGRCDSEGALREVLAPWKGPAFVERFNLMGALCQSDPTVEELGRRVEDASSAHEKLRSHSQALSSRRAATPSAVRELAWLLSTLAGCLTDLRRSVIRNGPSG